MATAWYAYSITQTHGLGTPPNTHGWEDGVDFGTPFHTPITALFGGTVVWSGRTQWSGGGSSGGMVAVKVNLPGHGVVTSYYLHLDTAAVKVGDVVQPGQLLGLSGGQLSGGQWPVRNIGGTFSTGPHVEFGFNAAFVPGGTGRNGNEFDPTNYISAARNGTLPVINGDGSGTIPATGATGQPLASGTGATQSIYNFDPSTIESGQLAYFNLSTKTHRILTQPDGFDGICEAIDAAEQLPDWNWFNPLGSLFASAKPMMIRALFMWFGWMIILFALADILISTLGFVLGKFGQATGAGAGSSAATTALEEAPEAVAL